MGDHPELANIKGKRDYLLTLATGRELALLAARTSNALQHVVVALDALRRGDDADLDNAIAELSDASAKIWETVEQPWLRNAGDTDGTTG